MITTLEQFYEERYRALELELMGDVGRRMGKEFPNIRAFCLEHWRRILGEAVKTQKEERASCGYMSISLLNISLLEEQPMFQVDFYTEDWVYGDPWSRGRMPADFLFREWEEFRKKTMDSRFYVRNKLQETAIASLFWSTAEKILYLFACFAKYFARELAQLPEFRALEKEDTMYVTCGTYLDWQERIYGILPELDLTDVPENEQTSFREFRGKTYRQQAFRDLDLRHCSFYDCTFRQCVFHNVNLSDGYFKNCRFRDTNFVEVGMAGCVWEDSDFKSCNFQSSGTQTEGDEYFAEAEMVRVRLTAVRAMDCDFSHFRRKECREADVHLEQVQRENSDGKNCAGEKADD